MRKLPPLQKRPQNQPDPDIYPLSRHQVKIMEVIANGHDVNDTAMILNLRPNTVVTSVRKAANELGVVDPLQAFLIAFRDGLIHPDLPKRRKMPPRKPTRKLTRAEQRIRVKKWHETYEANKLAGNHKVGGQLTPEQRAYATQRLREYHEKRRKERQQADQTYTDTENPLT